SHQETPIMAPRPARALRALTLSVALLLLAAPLPAQERADTSSLPTIAAKTRGMERLDGFMPLYLEERTGKVWLEVPRSGEELLYYVSLPAGVGHNDIGLNRGDLGPRYVVRFERVGPKL